MPYLDCPECHASFQTGVLYFKHDSCPRCGAALNGGGRRRGRRHRSAVEPLDWETITRSQYAHSEYVVRPDRGDQGWDETRT
jgi:hypothetical protein